MNEYRQKRREKCVQYLRMAGSIPSGKALAKQEGWSANTPAWISALASILPQLGRPVSEETWAEQRLKLCPMCRLAALGSDHECVL